MQNIQNNPNFSSRYSLRTNYFQTIILIQAKALLPPNREIRDYISHISADDSKFVISRTESNTDPDKLYLFDDCRRAYYSNQLECKIDEKFLIKKLNTSFYDVPILCIFKLADTSDQLYADLPDGEFETEIYTVWR